MRAMGIIVAYVVGVATPFMLAWIGISIPWRFRDRPDECMDFSIKDL